MMKHPSQQRGQGLVEFAVIFPLFAFLMFAVIDGGLLMGRYNKTNHAATVASRFGAVQNANASTAANDVLAQVKEYAPAPPSGSAYQNNCPNFDTLDYAVCVQWLSGPNGEQPGDVGSSIRVKVKYHYKLITPLVNRIGNWDVTACSIERQEQPITNMTPSYTGTTGSCSDASATAGTPSPIPTNTPKPTNTPIPTNTPKPPTATPKPPTATNTPKPPTPTRTPTPTRPQKTATAHAQQTASAAATATERAERTATSVAATATERAERTATSVAATATAEACPYPWPWSLIFCN